MYAWFARPDKVNTEPYYELFLSVAYRSLVPLRVDSHSLPIEQGRKGKPQVHRHLNIRTFLPPELWPMSAIVALKLFALMGAFGNCMQTFPGFSWCHEVFHVA